MLVTERRREPGLGEMYAIVRSEMALSKRIADLAHQLSDANLAAMPEFHQRIAVLRQLECVPCPETHLFIKP